jgi:hypothetical protein
MTLDPKQKKIAAAVGAGALLGLVVLLTRGQSSSTGTAASGQADTGGVTDPSSFADNGAAMGQLSSDVTGALAGVQATLGNLPASLTSDDVAAGVSAGLGSYYAAHPADPAAPAPPAQLAGNGQPAATTAGKTTATKAKTPTIAGAKVVKAATKTAPAVYQNTTPGNPRKGQTFTVAKNGAHIYKGAVVGPKRK